MLEKKLISRNTKVQNARTHKFFNTKMQTHIEKRNKYMEGKMSKNALTPLVVHPSTTSHTFAGYPKVQKCTFIKTTFELNKPVHVLTQIRASHHFKRQRLDCKSNIVADGIHFDFWYPYGTQWVKGTTLMRCL